MSRTFADLGLSPRVVDVLASRDIIEPFPIQLQTIEPALDGYDILAQAPTGSGKTLGFGLPLLEIIADDKGHGIRGLVLAPTRELAVQICDDLAGPAKVLGVRIEAVYGGAGLGPQADRARRADILVATPGRLSDLEERGSARLDNVMVLVLDEADRMLDMGFAPQVERIVRLLPRERQTMLFSATLDGAVDRMVKKYTHEPVVVRIAHDKTAGLQVEHVFEPTTPETRVDDLVRILSGERDQTVVFVRTKRGADRLSKKLRARGVRSTAIHGGMAQSARLRELASFRDGRHDTIVATDVFARGIDMDDISHVVNYDPPGDADTYMHRIGRTGRAGRSGIGISLVAPDQLSDMLAIADQIGLLEEGS